MAATAQCACSGIRTCLRCEQSEIKQNISGNEQNHPMQLCIFCSFCGNTYSSGQKCMHFEKDSTDSCTRHVKLEGVLVIHDFINKDEEALILNEIDSTIWKPSQSGRRKQDYGPQVNFKKRKLKWNNFTGLPGYSKFLVERMWTSVAELTNFKPVELCNLEYVPDRGSSIDPHFDDVWVWGERLVTVNLLSDSVLTFSNEDHMVEVAVTMPRRSLIIVSGPARYEWKHAIKRQHITSRRIAVTLRELSQEFCAVSASYDIGLELTRIALTFQGTSVQMKVKKDKL